MLTVCSFFAGSSLAVNNWIVFGSSLGCAIYWAVSLILKNKKKSKAVVNMSDDTKETLKNLGIKININGTDIV
jgi:hypothetical protein